MFTKILTQAGRTRRFTITEGARLGWEMRVEEDNRGGSTRVLPRLAPRRAGAECDCAAGGEPGTRGLARVPDGRVGTVVLLDETVAKPDDGFDLFAGGPQLGPQPPDVD